MAVVAVDFDHTLIDTPTSNPLPGARDAISRLREDGHRIIIHSCNNPKWIEKWLNDNDIRFDWIWDMQGKPIADIYIDDKGFRFSDWKQDLPLIKDLLIGYDNRKADLIHRTGDK